MVDNLVENSSNQNITSNNTQADLKSNMIAGLLSQTQTSKLGVVVTEAEIIANSGIATIDNRLKVVQNVSRLLLNYFYIFLNLKVFYTFEIVRLCYIVM